MESLEPRLHFSTDQTVPLATVHASDRSSALLQRSDGSTQPIVSTQDTWIVIHGWGGSPAAMGSLASAVQIALPQDQLLSIDWTSLANTDIVTATNNTQKVADSIAQEIKQIGLPASRINLLGFSLGALISTRLAADLQSIGGVNRIIALDPAAPVLGVKANGNSIRPILNLSANSKYSIAFHAGDTYIAADTSAVDTVLLTDVGGSTSQHDGVFDFFTSMETIDNESSPDAISRLFSMQRIMNGNLPAWHKHSFGGVYEAILDAKTVSSTLVPNSLEYKVGRVGHTVLISA